MKGSLVLIFGNIIIFFDFSFRQCTLKSTNSMLLKSIARLVLKTYLKDELHIYSAHSNTINIKNIQLPFLFYKKYQHKPEQEGKSPTKSTDTALFSNEGPYQIEVFAVVFIKKWNFWHKMTLTICSIIVLVKIGFLHITFMSINCSLTLVFSSSNILFYNYFKWISVIFKTKTDAYCTYFGIYSAKVMTLPETYVSDSWFAFLIYSYLSLAFILFLTNSSDSYK